MPIKKLEFYEGAALHRLARTGRIDSLKYASPFFIFNEFDVSVWPCDSSVDSRPVVRVVRRSLNSQSLLMADSRSARLVVESAGGLVC